MLKIFFFLAHKAKILLKLSGVVRLWIDNIIFLIKKIYKNSFTNKCVFLQKENHFGNKFFFGHCLLINFNYLEFNAKNIYLSEFKFF